MKDILYCYSSSNGLDTPVESMKGVGIKRAQFLKKMGIETLGDALFHFPRRYEDRRFVKRIAEVMPGQVEVVRGTIVEIQSAKAKKTFIVNVRLSDGPYNLTAVWFNQRHIIKWFKKGQEIIVVGRVKSNFGRLELLVQEFEEASKGQISGRIVPFYPATSGLPQNIIRSLVAAALLKVANLPDRLPQYLRQKYHLSNISEALIWIHCPLDFKQLDEARKRLIFEELFLHQLFLSRFLYTDKASLEGIMHSGPNQLKSSFLQTLEFRLTDDQARVAAEIEADMESRVPMRRLLQGDVGSGKTIVAIIAMLKSISNGFQAALMVPTEILAEQHFISLTSTLCSLGINVKLLTGSITGEARRKILEGTSDGSINIIIGTQALIQGQVNFHSLGLVVIDEQHRFGVAQRSRLAELVPNPHVLVMTATPIPRSLELTFYGDLDLSVIREMPPGRKKIVTRFVAESKRNRLYEFMKENLRAGRQAFVVCPLIEESESLEIAAAEELAEKLKTEVFPEFCIGLLHGKLKPGQKEKIMNEFKNKRIKILVSTTVIEVGIDVPNANIIVIEGTERFGLAQLHQLRGRVGRGPWQSYCFLLGKAATKEAEERIKAMLACTSGFDIAERDLEIRGPGDLLGTKQHGLPAFKIADLVRDLALAIEINQQIKGFEKNGFPGSPEELQLLETCCTDIFSQFAAN